MQVDETGTIVKLCDFGLAKVTDLDVLTSVPRNSTPCYQAPETIGTVNKWSKEADVFSFGLVVYEIMTYDFPFQVEYHAGGEQAVLEKIKKGELPTVPSQCNPRFRHVFEICSRYDPKKRPTIAQVVKDIFSVNDFKPYSKYSVEGIV